MPQFAFRATDRLGNTVDGNLEAADHAAAIAQIQQMGYTPIGVQLVGVPTPATPQRTAALTAVGTPAPAPTGGRRRPVDLTQEVTEMPEAAVDLFAQSPVEATQEIPPATSPLHATPYQPAPTNGSEGDSATAEMTARMARLEPWERSVAANMAEATTAMPPQAAAPTQQMNPMGGPSREPLRHRNALTRGLERIPFGANSLRKVSPGQRFKEVMIYPLFSGVVLKDLAPWYRQFATLISAGLPIYQSLSALADNTKNPRLKEVSQNGVRQVQAGGYFSDVMAAYPWIFPPMHLEMLRAAEQGGMIEQSLRQIGDYVEHEMGVRRLIAKETLYPKLVLLALVFLMGRPGIFEGMPAISVWFLSGNTNQYLRDTLGFALLILVPILALVAFFRLTLFNVPGMRGSYDSIKINLPVVGKIVRHFAIARFSRTYAALSKAGFAAGSALQVAGDASGNVVIARAAQHAMREAERGTLPSEALRATGQFSVMSLDMLRTGETSGSLDAMMDKVADYHEAEGKSSTHLVAMLFTVTVLLLVGLVVFMTVFKFWGNYAGQVSAAGSGGE